MTDEQELIAALTFERDSALAAVAAFKHDYPSFDSWHAANAKYMESVDIVPWCQQAWDDSRQAALGEFIDVIRDVLREEGSQLSYGVASQIQQRLRQVMENANPT